MSLGGFWRRERRRELRPVAHAAFDQLWKRGLMSRKQAYRWLAEEFDLSPYAAHFSRLPADVLREVPLRVKAYLHANGGR